MEALITTTAPTVAIEEASEGVEEEEEEEEEAMGTIEAVDKIVLNYFRLILGTFSLSAPYLYIDCYIAIIKFITYQFS